MSGTLYFGGLAILLEVEEESTRIFSAVACWLFG